MKSIYCYSMLSKFHYKFIKQNKLFLTLQKYIETFDIYPNYYFIMFKACELGDIFIINWLDCTDPKELHKIFHEQWKCFSQVNTFILGAIDNGHLDILNLFYNLGFIFNTSIYDIDDACEKGHIKVLDRLYGLSFKMEITEFAIKSISRKKKRINILDWLHNKKFIVDSPINIWNFLSKDKDLDVIKWFNIKGYKIKYTVRKNSIKCISFKENIDILNWFKDFGHSITISHNAIDTISENGPPKK